MVTTYGKSLSLPASNCLLIHCRPHFSMLRVEGLTPSAPHRIAGVQRGTILFLAVFLCQASLLKVAALGSVEAKQRLVGGHVVAVDVGVVRHAGAQ